MMAKLSHERASSKASSLISTINLIVIALELIASQQRQADAFPLLFNRPSIFRRTNQQQQAKQQQQQIQQQQQQQFANQPVELIPLANSQVPILNRAPVQSVNLQQYVQAGQLHPAELMRLSSIHQQIGAQPLHHLANQQQQQQAASNTNGATSSVLSMSSNMNANMDSAAQAAAYYKPNIVQPASFSSTEHQQQQQQQQNFDAIQPTSFDLYDNAQPDYLTKVQSIGNAASQSAQQQQMLKSASSSGDNSGQGMHLEPTHTSEVVDKIEEHIGRQIEQSLGESDHQQHFFNQPSFRQAAASGYHEQAAAKAAEAEEKSEAASSGGEGGESSESSGGGGEESGAEEKAEKREEHEHKHHEPKEVKEEHHQHVEHPPEAFEVHHKKGGKSFQYFHQGHHQ